MAVTTLHEAIADLLRLSGDGFQSSTSSLAGSNTTLVDQALQDSAEPTTSYKTGHVKVIQGSLSDEVRRVADYDRSNGTLTVGRPYGTAAPSGMAYQFSQRLPFVDLARCVNWALSEAYLVDQAVITPATAGQVSLPSWITSREQIVRGLGRIGTVADSYTYYPVEIRHLEAAGTSPGVDEQVLKVQLQPPVLGQDALVVFAVRPYPALTSGSAPTSMAKEWLVPGALTRYYEVLAGRVGKEDVARYKDQAALWRARWLAQCASRQPNESRPTQFAQPFVPVTFP
jgi:hypothetical protein